MTAGYNRPVWTPPETQNIDYTESLKFLGGLAALVIFIVIVCLIAYLSGCDTDNQ
jgi:hypothetical protein